MSDNESVVTIDYNIEKEIEYGRKFIKDDIKNCKNCKLIHYQLRNNFNNLFDGVNENIFSYIGCSNCVDRMRYLEYDVSVLIYSLVGNNDYPEHFDIIINVIQRFNTNFCIPTVYCNVFKNELTEYNASFHASYGQLYTLEIHYKFEEVYNHYFNKVKVKELRQLLIQYYNTRFHDERDIIELHDFLYHYLRIFSIIITYLNKRHVFYDLIEWLKFIIIDQ